jgi:tRNA-splicing ligase RtcB
MQILTKRLYNWASLLDDGALEQAERTSRLCDPAGNPIIAGHVALMPDAHWGIGSTVGSVIPTEGHIIPSAVGVDIGCGMVAARTSLKASHLPDSLDSYLHQAERDVPAGVGRGHREPTPGALRWFATHPPPTQFSEQQWARALGQLGSLGSGNHFYEVCLDEEDSVWLVLHSGSRGIGNELANIHIKRARQLMADAGAVIEDANLAYLTQDTPEFDAYIADMRWAQEYAMANRAEMIEAAMRGFLRHVGMGEWIDTINCHHNYTSREEHGGRLLWITRKGAIRAAINELGVIPGSMGAASYIVCGRGNPDSYTSSSHGAGRLMSRGEAVRTIGADALRHAMAGKSWQVSDAEYLVDESPQAYKPIDQVMEDQRDLTQVVHTLHQVFNYKGVERGRRTKARAT